MAAARWKAGSLILFSPRRGEGDSRTAERTLIRRASGTFRRP